MSAYKIPDELWRKILEIGVKSSNFSYKDLCCVSISCRHLHRLSCEDSLWSHLISADFPNQASGSSSSLSALSSSRAKSLYRIRFGREKERRVAAHRRALLRKESEINERRRKIREMGTRLTHETERLQAAMVELSNLQKVRQASIALKVWQPEVVWGRQKQIVEQNAVPVESRIHSLEMEMKLCKQHISGFNKALGDAKQRLDKAVEELDSMKYHPLKDCKSMFTGDEQSNIKRKKLKTCINFPELPSKTSQHK